MQRHDELYLFRRGHTFYFRFRIPQQFIEVLGVHEIKRSLRTSDPRLARRRSRRISVALEQLITWLKDMADPTKSDIIRIAREYLERELKANVHATLTPFKDDDYAGAYQADQWKQEHMALQEKIGDSFYDEQLSDLVGKLLSKKGFDSGEVDGEPHLLACHFVLRAQAEVARIMVAKFKGEHPEAIIKDSAFIRGGVGSYAVQVGDMGDPVSTIVEKYIAAKKDKVWSHKTLLDNERVLGWFKDLLNEDKAIENVSFEDVRDFRDALEGLPRNLSKFSKFDGLRIADTLVVGKDDPKISSKTAQKYFQLLRAFFSWCAENNYLHEVPAPKLKILHSANPADARHPYSVKQLQSLLVSPLYVGHTKKARHKPGEYLYKDGRYWMPLLAMFSGARAGELIQLYDDDIIQVGDIWCLDVNADKGKSLKTMSSVRRIPIHSQILKLGFLDFVADKQTKSKTGRLFEEFPIQGGSVANAFSKWYRRFSVKIEIYSSKTPFHAFRHNFKDALVQAGTPDSIIMAILGHKNTSVTAQYGSGIAVTQLSEWIEKISLGLSFDHLKPYQGKQTPFDKPV